MISTKGYAELNAEQTKSITSTLESVIVLLELTLFKEFVQNVKLMKLIMNTPKPAILLLAQE